MNLPFKTLQVLHDAPGGAIFREPMRILGCVEASDILWLIPVLPKKLNEAAGPAPSQEGSEVANTKEPLATLPAKKKRRAPAYARGPQAWSLTQVLHDIEAFRVFVSEMAVDKRLKMTDDQLLTSADSSDEKQKLETATGYRDDRYASILPILTGGYGETPRPFIAVINDPRLGSMISKRAKETGKSRSSIYHVLHLYWRAGNQKNGLFPNFDKCGLPGVEKTQKIKVGRQSRLFKARLATSTGFTVNSPEDKRKLEWGYRLIKHNVTAHMAYLLTCSVHWADRVTVDDGTLDIQLWQPERRPTFNQFLYWGKKSNGGRSFAEAVLGKLKWERHSAARGGSLQDQVAAAGQVVAFDSTSTDVYLTSYMSRLRKLPPMTRLVLKDTRTELILGFYCGWQPPSPASALMAVLHAATSHAAYCQRYGVTITEDEWPALLPKTILTDNGEFKGSTPTEAERQFGFSIDYTPTNSGDRKGAIESQHRSDHKQLDHKLPGSTMGRARKRGEDHAASNALWNYYEYIRELIWAVLEHNNQEVPDLAPIEMLREVPAIKPTRLNIFHWLRRHGMVVETIVDPDALRAFTLPKVDAVIRKNGLYLEVPVHGRKMLLPRLRYSSPEFVATGLMSRVKVAGQTVRTAVHMDKSDPSRVWLPTKQGMIMLTLATTDSNLKQQVTLEDWIDHIGVRLLAGDLQTAAGDQKKMAKVLRREAITESAKAQLAEETKKMARPPSKASHKRDLRVNRDRELADLLQQEQQMWAAKNRPHIQPDPKLPSTHETQLTAAELAMREQDIAEFGNEH